MTALPKAEPTLISPQEYLAQERVAEQKSQYLDGEVFAMAGASTAHTRITGNIHALLWTQLQDKPCEPLMLDQRVRTPSDDLYTYPDVLVVCGPEYSDDEFDTVTNPRVIIEVLSPSTRDFDHSTKFNRYRTIPSMEDYVLVAQDRVLVEHRSRYAGTDRERWWTRILEHSEEELILDSIGCRIRVSSIYARVNLDPSVGSKGPA
jgi:Uma2 family endonuclease